VLHPQIVVHLFPQISESMQLVSHTHRSVWDYRGTAAIASANKTMGQSAMKTSIPNATSSDK
jgi:hypothetical protein